MADNSSQTTFDFQPVIIIGAGRSGTNMLREMLTQIPGVGTWPCDEINYIWRHYNASVPHDEFSRQEAKPSTVRYIRGAFQKMARQTHSQLLIEKTCANSLRVNFVDAVIPEAKYVFIVRDGRDVVLSAMKRWQAKLDPKYILKKVPFVPVTDIPYYAFKYIGNRLHRMTSTEKRLSTWGPKFIGMRERLALHPLDEVCAIQWQECVLRAKEGLAALPSDRVHELRYEDMASGSEATFDHLLRFLNLDITSEQRTTILNGVFSDSVGGWRQKMADEQRSRIESLVGSTLTTFGYETVSDHKLAVSH